MPWIFCFIFVMHIVLKILTLKYVLNIHIWNVTISYTLHSLPTLLTFITATSHTAVLITMWDFAAYITTVPYEMGSYDCQEKHDRVWRNDSYVCDVDEIFALIFTCWYALAVCICILVCINRHNMLEQSIWSRSLQKDVTEISYKGKHHVTRVYMSYPHFSIHRRG